MKDTSEKRFCGNCGRHSAYNYPDEVFCSRNFIKKEKAIVPTLWCCEDWTTSVQGCHCVEDATRKQKTK